MSDPLVKISLRRCHAQTVKYGASSHILSEIRNLEGHLNCCIGSKVTVILLKGLILTIGGSSVGEDLPCSLCRRLVFNDPELKYGLGHTKP